MSDTLERRAETILARVLGLPEADRPAAATGACGADAALLRRVMSLLSTEPVVGGFMSDATMDGPAFGSAAPVGEKPGDTIGRYRLLEKIGEGGFGVVFTAEQQKPVRRLVAIKVIKLGMDTREVVARFEAERQALALMDHPNIAKVLDAGSTETGRPYFVMELVRGSAVTEYADKHKLSTKDRVALAAQICRAVQHAHSKGVIHRDLKPSNVLVTVTDDKPVPKVIDFGIAKATQSRLTDHTLYTAHRQLIGTPQYMSPEQADSDGSDIDTRTDVYSLGVLLYELLVGTTPHDARELRSAAYEQMRKIIRDTEVPHPSTKLNTMAAGTRGTVAANRSTDLKKLSQSVKGELDWIVMKSLEKDRTRRYETAAAMADDLNRYLTGEAVLAGPVSGAYRLRKTLKRYKAAVVIGGVIAACLLLGVAGTTWGLILEAEQRAVAEGAERRAAAEAAVAVAERRVAVEQRAEAQRQQALAEADSAELGATVVAATDPRKSDRLLVQAYNIRHGVLALDDPAVIRVLEKHVENLWKRPARPEALATLQSAITSLRQCGRTDSRPFATLLYDAADLIRQSTNGGAGPAGAVPLLREASGILRRISPDDPDLGRDLYWLGRCLFDDHHPDAAEPYLAEAYAFDRAHPTPEGMISVDSYVLLNQCLGALGKPPAPAPQVSDTPTTPAVARGRADALARSHHNDDAEPFYRLAVQLDRAAKPVDRLVLAADLFDLGTCLQRQSRTALADGPFREAMEIDRTDLPPDDPGRVDHARRFAGHLVAAGAAAEAVTVWQEVVASDERTRATSDVRAFDLRDLGRALDKAGDLVRAEQTLRKAVDLRASVSGATDSETAAVARSLAVVLVERGDGAGADRVRLAAGIGAKKKTTTRP